MILLLHINSILSNKFVKYGLVGILGTFLHFAILIFLVRLLGSNVLFSSTFGFIVVLIISYFLNKHWTFQSSEQGIQEFTKYSIVSLIGLLLNTIVMYLSIYVFGFNYIIGQFLVVLIVPVSNFCLNNIWAFKVKRESTNYNNHM